MKAFLTTKPTLAGAAVLDGVFMQFSTEREDFDTVGNTIVVLGKSSGKYNK